MATKIINKKYVGTGLNYIKNEKGLYFYHDNNLLILHDDKTPFLKLNLNGETIPLSESKVIRNNDNEYTIDFFGAGHSVICRLQERDGVISFCIEDPKNYEISINLYKEKYQRVIGIDQKIGDIEPDGKLSFYVEQKYFFENVNIKKYGLEIADKILLTAQQPRICFIVDTVNTPQSLEKMSHVNVKEFKVFRKRKIFEMIDNLYYISGNYRDGLIIDNCEELDMVPFLTEHYGKIIFTLRFEFRMDSHLVCYFSQDELTLTENGTYRINFDCPTAQVSLKTVVRKYFDSGLAGIYLDTSLYTVEELDIIKNAILSIVPEYTKKIILYNNLPVTGGYFGYYIVKDKKKLFSYPQYMDIYKYSGEFFLGAEVKSFDEAERVPEVCKIVIVNTIK